MQAVSNRSLIQMPDEVFADRERELNENNGVIYRTRYFHIASWAREREDTVRVQVILDCDLGWFGNGLSVIETRFAHRCTCAVLNAASVA